MSDTFAAARPSQFKISSRSRRNDRHFATNLDNERYFENTSSEPVLASLCCSKPRSGGAVCVCVCMCVCSVTLVENLPLIIPRVQRALLHHSKWFELSFYKINFIGPRVVLDQLIFHWCFFRLTISNSWNSRFTLNWRTRATPASSSRAKISV